VFLAEDRHQDVEDPDFVIAVIDAGLDVEHGALQHALEADSASRDAVFYSAEALFYTASAACCLTLLRSAGPRIVLQLHPISCVLKLERPVLRAGAWPVYR
jgi:hypothetical protein